MSQEFDPDEKYEEFLSEYYALEREELKVVDEIDAEYDVVYWINRFEDLVFKYEPFFTKTEEESENFYESVDDLRFNRLKSMSDDQLLHFVKESREFFKRHRYIQHDDSKKVQELEEMVEKYKSSAKTHKNDWLSEVEDNERLRNKSNRQSKKIGSLEKKLVKQEKNYEAQLQQKDNKFLKLKNYFKRLAKRYLLKVISTRDVFSELEVMISNKDETIKNLQEKNTTLQEYFNKKIEEQKQFYENEIVNKDSIIKDQNQQEIELRSHVSEIRDWVTGVIKEGKEIAKEAEIKYLQIFEKYVTLALANERYRENNNKLSPLLQDIKSSLESEDYGTLTQYVLNTIDILEQNTNLNIDKKKIRPLLNKIEVQDKVQAIQKLKKSAGKNVKLTALLMIGASTLLNSYFNPDIQYKKPSTYHSQVSKAPIYKT